MIRNIKGSINQFTIWLLTNPQGISPLRCEMTTTNRRTVVREMWESPFRGLGLFPLKLELYAPEYSEIL